MYKFENEATEFDGEIFPHIVFTLTEEASLDNMLEAFESFLRASGYVFNGRVVIEDEIDGEGGIE